LKNLYILDLEADGLRDQATKIHCVVVRDYDGNATEYLLGDPDHVEAFKTFLWKAYEEGASLAGHFILGYDWSVLDRLVGVPPFHEHLSDLRLIDTLVLSRMMNYKIAGGHSLEAWGHRLGVQKEGVGITDWSTFSAEMLKRCYSDTDINLQLYKKKFERFVNDPKWRMALGTEMEIAWICTEMSITGIPFNVEGANKLRQELLELLAPIDETIARDFKPKAVPIKEVHPRINQDGTLNRQDFRWYLSSVSDDDLSVFDGGPYTRFEYVDFNPASHKQIIDRMWDAGWKPTEKTDGHVDAVKEGRVTDAIKRFGWKVNEENLKTLPDTAPEAARSLAKRIVISSRLSDLEEWIELVGEDGRLHPEYSSIGAWTERVSHSKPNSANIPASKPSATDTEFDKQINAINDRMRELFHAPEGMRLIGTDADGIQMRIFAHVINDQRLIKALVEGNKENGTDIHTLHKGALGSTAGSRDEAKTFIYAFLLGAGIGRVSEIFSCGFGEAKTAVARFLEFYPGLKTLKKTLLPQWAAQGWFEALDGRKVPCDSAHLMLAGILQSGEKIIMSMAMIQWIRKLRELKIPFELVNWVHDEWQTLIPDDDDIAKIVSDIQIQSLRDQGDVLKMRCPLEGTTSINHKTGFIGGYTWKETH
jgi:DNA polymerase-1